MPLNEDVRALHQVCMSVATQKAADCIGYCIRHMYMIMVPAYHYLVKALMTPILASIALAFQSGALLQHACLMLCKQHLLMIFH